MGGSNSQTREQVAAKKSAEATIKRTQSENNLAAAQQQLFQDIDD